MNGWIGHRWRWEIERSKKVEMHKIYGNEKIAIVPFGNQLTWLVRAFGANWLWQRQGKGEKRRNKMMNDGQNEFWVRFGGGEGNPSLLNISINLNSMKI